MNNCAKYTLTLIHKLLLITKGYIYVPSAGEMFPKGQQAGAYIHNGSWGSSWNTYTFRTRDFDAYTYENEDFLIFMAAGNSGYRNRMQTILSPANAKNVVAGEYSLLHRLDKDD